MTELRIPEGVSKNFPNRTEMSEFEISRIDESWVLDDDFFASLVGADCWGVYITRRDGTIIPIMNTYALFEDIGRSFRVGHRSTPQYESERKVRRDLMNNISILLDELSYGDTASIMMFGSEPWRVDATRNSSNEITYASYACQDMIDRFLTQNTNSNHRPCHCQEDDN